MKRGTGVALLNFKNTRKRVWSLHKLILYLYREQKRLRDIAIYIHKMTLKLLTDDRQRAKYVTSRCFPEEEFFCFSVQINDPMNKNRYTRTNISLFGRQQPGLHLLPFSISRSNSQLQFFS
ncbi:MAG: hypothetical protein H6557_24290 [Lewinellaceae bacterium]|nr:hypothetical protein [Phaeodactylibacter sp.]MCB9039750.1 hypothetical protein [Lewinellaceae bacterium]